MFIFVCVSIVSIYPFYYNSFPNKYHYGFPSDWHVGTMMDYLEEKIGAQTPDWSAWSSSLRRNVWMWGRGVFVKGWGLNQQCHNSDVKVTIVLIFGDDLRSSIRGSWPLCCLRQDVTHSVCVWKKLHLQYTFWEIQKVMMGNLISLFLQSLISGHSIDWWCFSGVG